MKIDEHGRVILEGAGNYGFTVAVDGADLVCDRALGTWFGGANDSDDDGSTASGLSTRDNPDYVGCSLPMSFEPACHGTPLPRLQWYTVVHITDLENDLTIEADLIDVGPAAPPKAQGHIDLTVQAMRDIKGFTADNTYVKWVIYGGFHLLPTDLQVEIKNFRAR